MVTIKEEMQRFGTRMDLWFEEKPEFRFGTTLRVLVDETLCNVHSDYQEIAVLKTAGLGRMLVIDGIIMLTEFDEYVYHEMIAHVPLLVHPGPDRVLVVGGGDGGSVREILRHPQVRRVDLCEIDPKVIEVSRKHLPTLSCGLDDPRVTVHYADGARFVEEHPATFDVIIVDSTDPFGPGEVLFQEPFYRAVYRALREDGIVVSQCESFFYHQEVIRDVNAFVGKLFPFAAYYYCSVPSYPSGTIGFAWGSKTRHPIRDLDEKRYEALGAMRYYTPAVHRAAFQLPAFARSFCPSLE